MKLGSMLKVQGCLHELISWALPGSLLPLGGLMAALLGDQRAEAHFKVFALAFLSSGSSIFSPATSLASSFAAPVAPLDKPSPNPDPPAK